MSSIEISNLKTFSTASMYLNFAISDGQPTLPSSKDVFTQSKTNILRNTWLCTPRNHYWRLLWWKSWRLVPWSSLLWTLYRKGSILEQSWWKLDLWQNSQGRHLVSHLSKRTSRRFYWENPQSRSNKTNEPWGGRSPRVDAKVLKRSRPYDPKADLVSLDSPVQSLLMTSTFQLII